MASVEEVRLRAVSALEQSDYDSALGLAGLIQRHFPEDYRAVQLRGRVYLEMHRLSDAIDAFNAVLDVDPENVVAWSALAMIAEEEGDLDGALEHFERAFEVDPGNHEIASEIERIRSGLSVDSPPESGSSVHAMARRLLIEKKYESAIPWLQEALRATPDSFEVALSLARALWHSLRPQEAEEVARELLGTHPNCLRALAILAGAVSPRGEEARTILARTAKMDPGNPVARAIFAEVGLEFPEIHETLDIPDVEIESVLSGQAQAEPPSGEVEPAEELSSPNEETLFSRDEGTPAEVAQTGPDDEPLDQDSETQEPEPEAGEPEESNPLLRRLAALRDLRTDEQTSYRQSLQEERFADPQNAVADPSAAAAPAPGLGARLGRGMPGEPSVEDTERDAAARALIHMQAGDSYAARGLVDQAISEYQTALKLDHSTAQDVSEAVLQLAEADPTNVRARWLAGDALTLNGRFRKAVEQYMQVLNEPPGSSSDPSTVR